VNARKVYTNIYEYAGYLGVLRLINESDVQLSLFWHAEDAIGCTISGVSEDSAMNGMPTGCIPDLWELVENGCNPPARREGA